MDYILKRSNRKTIGIEVTPEGVLVRAPKRATAAEIERLLRKHRRWIEKRQEALAADLETARAFRGGPAGPCPESEAVHSRAGRCLRSPCRRQPGPDHHPHPEKPLGQLQFEREPEL